MRDAVTQVPGVEESGGYNYVGGRRVVGTGEEQPLGDPATGELLATMRLSSSDDVDRAVAAARAAFAGWSRTPPVERAEILARWARLLHERAEDLALAETRQCGKPIRLSREFDVPGSIDNVAFFAGAARNLEGKAVGGVLTGSHLDGPPGADRGRRCGRPVELPLADGGVEGASRDRRRQYGRTQAQRADPADPDAVRRGRRRGRPAGRCPRRGGRRRRGGGRAPCRPPGRRHGLLHRLQPGRSPGDDAGRRDAQAGPPRARRQGPVRRLRRRRPRRRGPRGGSPGR